MIHRGSDMARIDWMGKVLFLPQSWKWKMDPFNISFLSCMVIFNFHDYGRKSTQEKAVLFQGEAMMQSWIEVLFFGRPFLLSGYPETRRLVGFRLNIHLMGFNHPLPPWWVGGFSSLLPRPVSSHGGGTLWDVKLMRIAAMSRKDSMIHTGEVYI